MARPLQRRSPHAGRFRKPSFEDPAEAIGLFAPKRRRIRSAITSKCVDVPLRAGRNHDAISHLGSINIASTDRHEARDETFPVKRRRSTRPDVCFTILQRCDQILAFLIA